MHAHHPAALLVGLLLAVGFSGCLGTQAGDRSDPLTPMDTPAAPSTVEAGNGSATIEGSVVEDDLTPVEGATVIVRALQDTSAVLGVGLRDSGSETRVMSSGDGTFRVGGLEPGPYAVTATKAGFRDAPPRTIDVREGATEEVRLVLIGLPSDTPSHTIIPFVFRLNAIVVRHPAGDQTVIQGGNLNPTDSTAYRYGVFHNVEESPTALLQTAMFEVGWTPTQELCKFGVRSRINGPGTSDNAEANSWIGKDPTQNPSKLRVPREGTGPDSMMSEERTALNGGKPIVTTGRWFAGGSYVFAGTAGTPVDVSCAVDQKVDAWSSYFLVGPAPQDWSARA